MKPVDAIVCGLVALAACGGGDSDLKGGTDGSDSDDTSTAGELGVGALEIHYFHDKAWKVAAYDGLVLVTTQHGEEIWSWDPSTQVVEEFARDLGDVQGVTSWLSSIWVTHSISGVEGSVSELTVPNSLSLAATSTASGELMRRPLEMAPLGDGLAIADMGGPRVWTLAPGADRVEAIETPEPPLTLETMDDQLFVGTDSGVFLWDDSAWSLVDDRPAYGLASHQGQLLAANAADGLFVAGEEGSTPLDGPARPGSMVAVGDALFFVDEVGGSLWSLPSVP